MAITASRAGPVRVTTMLRVWKRSGTHGDTLIAWGLALLVNDVMGRPVTIRNTPGAYEIEMRGSLDEAAQACKGWVASDRVRLPFLACAASGRLAPEGSYAVDRDTLRDDYERLRSAGQQPAAGGDAPAVAAHPLAPRYPLFQVLTNPGTQWAGFNTLTQRASRLWTAEGAADLIRVFTDGLDSMQIDAHLDGLLPGLKGSERRVNPPGFLFPGSNKGPTMRIARDMVVTGQPAAMDWMMADRGDLSVVDLYLAYIGYFSVAQVHTYKGGRVISVPIPGHAIVPRGLDALTRVRTRAFHASPAATAAHAALRFAEAALTYHTGLMRDRPGDPPRQLLLAGIHHAIYWMPSGNTYAPQSVSVVPLPRWLLPLYERDGFDATHASIKLHEKQVASVGRAEGDEARGAINTYRESLSGRVVDWLQVMPAWYRAVQAERYVVSWPVGEIERIAVSLQPELAEIIRDEAFESITGAIRRSTIQAFYAREARRHGNAVPTPNRPDSPLAPQYDLVGALQEASARHPDEFLRQLCEFIAAYNDEVARGHLRAKLVRKEDIEQLIAWLAADRRGLIPALVLAFGVSPRRKAQGVADEETIPDEEDAVEREA